MRFRLRIFFRFFLVFVIVTLPAFINAGEGKKIVKLKPEGELYRIAEKDALDEIMERVKALDEKKLKEELFFSMRKKLNFRSKLQHACRNETFSFIPKFILDVDIRDEKGRVIYPKGYTFNPLDYIPFPFVFVFFDGDSKVEREWVKKSFLNGTGASFFLIATGGSIPELVKEFKRPVYVFTPELENRFQIKKTPSFAKAVNNTIVVQEVGVHRCQK